MLKFVSFYKVFKYIILCLLLNVLWLYVELFVFEVQIVEWVVETWRTLLMKYLFYYSKFQIRSLNCLCHVIQDGSPKEWC